MKANSSWHHSYSTERLSWTCRVSVLYFNYTHCLYICFMMIEHEGHVLQVGSPFLLLGSGGTGFICSGLSCVPWFLAAAGSVYVQGLHQCQRQGEGCMFFPASMLLCFLCCCMQGLTDCVIVFCGQLSAWLIPAVQTLNITSMTPPELTALSALLPQLGASFLLSLPSEQLLDIVSQPGLHRYSPAQVSRDCQLLLVTSKFHFCFQRGCRSTFSY